MTFQHVYATELSSLLDRNKPLVDGVVDALREGISQEIIKPGEKITEAALAKSLGISRTPVREALRRLEAEGIFQGVPGQGFTAVKYTYEDIINLYVVRETLEGLAARLAAENMSAVDIMMFQQLMAKMEDQVLSEEKSGVLISGDNFHNAIAKASKNPTLISFLESIYISIRMFRKQSLDHPDRDKVSFEEHKAIAEAIYDRDPDLAEKRSREHMQKALRNLIADSLDHLNW